MTIGQCDTLTCCWWELLDWFWWFTKDAAHRLWPVFAVYGILYAIGAASFLARLRFKQNESGKLVVDHGSLAYKVAHPYTFGQIRKRGIYSEGRLKEIPHSGGEFEIVGGNSKGVQIPKNGSICAFYARMFNMLLFVWPFLLLWFAVICGVGSLLGGLLFGAYIKPNLSNDGFLESGKFAEVFPVVVWGPISLVLLILWHWAKFLHVMGRIGWATLCIAPLLVVVAVVAFLVHKARADHATKGTTVNAFVEFTAARKERFCKVIEFE